MGYSISVKINNKEEQDKIMNFYNQYKPLFKEALACDREIHFDYDLQDNLSYAPSKKNVGFHSSSIPQGVWAMTIWISHAMGKDFVYYDNEKIPFTTDLNASNDYVKIEPNGSKIASKGFVSFFTTYNQKAFSAVVDKLNVAWQHYNEQLSQEKQEKNNNKKLKI